MDEERANFPLIIGVTAGILGALIAVTIMYSAKTHPDTSTKLRNAKEIIAQCHETIREIEENLDLLKEPAGA